MDQVSVEPERRLYPRKFIPLAWGVRIFPLVGERVRRQQKAYGFMRDFSAGGMRIDNIFGDLTNELIKGGRYAIQLPLDFFEEELYVSCKLVHQNALFSGFEFDKPRDGPHGS